MSCLSSVRNGVLLAGLISTGLSGAPLSPADQSAIEQQQKALLEQTQQQRDLLRHSTPAPSLPEATPAEPTGQCFALRHIRLENVTVLPLSVQRNLTAIPTEGCMVGLGKPGEVDVYKNQMRNNTFPLVPEKGVIAGYVDKKGVYYVSDGNHRMVAAVEYYNETGNPEYIKQLIKNGTWTYNATYAGTSKPLPVRK